MSLDAWFTLAVLFLCFVPLVFTRYPPDVILMGGLVLLLLIGQLSVREALNGFSNEGMLTVAALYIVVSGLSETGVLNWISTILLGRPKSIAAAQIRLMAPVALFSAFMNNTPVVAMMIPAVTDWARLNRLDVSKLMIPLSYAAIIGGSCTLIGTSSNLILNSMLMDLMPDVGLSLLELAWVGVPCAVVVISMVLLLSQWLLPEHGSIIDEFGDIRRYTVVMSIKPGSWLIGKTIEHAGLRRLPGMYLVSIQRQESIKPAVSPSEVLQADDKLMFAGVVESVVDLKKIPGLVLENDDDGTVSMGKERRSLVEVVVSPSCPLIGNTIKDGKFRAHYNAAIVAVARGSTHIQKKIGDIILRSGDTLLLDVAEDFAEQQRYSRDFLLVSEIKNSETLRHEQRYISVGILVLMILSVIVGWFNILTAALVAAGLMIMFRCTSANIARANIDLQVLVVIAASIGIGGAVEKSGLATSIAQQIISFGDGTPLGALLMLFLGTALFTSVLSNAAAAVLMFPIAIATGESLGVSVIPFVVTLMIGASASFATPIGYQTNLMVYGPGGYSYSDYFKLGLPVTIAVGLIVVNLVPLVWPF